jgi:hypothetical protein
MQMACNNSMRCSGTGFERKQLILRNIRLPRGSFEVVRPDESEAVTIEQVVDVYEEHTIALASI